MLKQIPRTIHHINERQPIIGNHRDRGVSNGGGIYLATPEELRNHLQLFYGFLKEL
jgi:hypothetical protein